MVYSTRSSCRLCSGDLKDIVSLGDIHLSTFLDTNENQPPKAPIDLVQCISCDLVQLRHTVNPETMYSEYWYQSGLNHSMQIALKDVVDRIQTRIDLRPGDSVLDIGANDGTLLTFYPDFVQKIACEPSDLIQLAINNDRADVYINDFFSLRAMSGCEKPRVITAIAMFYDLEDPHTFVADLCNVLSEDGLLVVQMMDLMSMVKLNDFPNLCHEHLEYYSLRVLCGLLAQHGLEVVDVEYNGVNGGSLRVYIKHTDKNPHNYTKIGNEIFRSEIAMAVEIEDAFFSNIDLADYFKTNIESVKTRITNYIHRCNTEGKKVAVLGASTKGNTTLQYFGLTDAHIDHAAEINPDKFGKRTVGSNIMILPQEISLSLKPNYYLVLPWGFIDFFVEKFKDYLDEGGQFIVPLPVPRIITKDGEWQIP